MAIEIQHQPRYDRYGAAAASSGQRLEEWDRLKFLYDLLIPLALDLKMHEDRTGLESRSLDLTERSQDINQALEKARLNLEESRLEAQYPRWANDYPWPGGRGGGQAGAGSFSGIGSIVAGLGY